MYRQTKCKSCFTNVFRKFEEQLNKNGDTSEALFVHLVCNWHRACDERGMAVDDRVNKLWAFHTYLVKDVDFNCFPAPGAYVKGIPIFTYSALLQNISMQLLLYKLCKYRTYNARCISSLVCESFFSMVTAKEPYGNGCPKAADVPKIMSDIITIETYKNRSDLNFHIQTVKKPLYPTQRETGQYVSDDTISSSYYPNHPFDIQHKKRKARNFKDVTGENRPFRVYIQNGLKLMRNIYQHKINQYFHILKMTTMNMFLKCKIFYYKECLTASNKFLLFLKPIHPTCFKFCDILLYNKETDCWLAIQLFCNKYTIHYQLECFTTCFAVSEQT